jgi:hypothetical protein
MAPREKFPVEVVEAALREAGGLRSQVARVLNCSVSTVTNYIDRYKRLQQVEREVVEEQLDFAEAQLIKNIKDGKEASLFFFLKCKGKQRGYVEKQIVESTGPGGGPLQHRHEHVRPDFDAMSDDELDAYIQDQATAAAGG